MTFTKFSPLVSVIIPGYNHAPFLQERIESVLGQTYPHIEVIMLDDASGDESAEIMQSYAQHKHVSHVIINKENSGNTFLQWQKGLAQAQGEYVWIAESDDVAHTNFLTALMEPLIKTPDAVMAFSWSTMIDEHGKPLPYSWDETKRFCAPGVYDSRPFCLQRMMFKNLMYNASMVVFRKECAANVNPQFMQYRHSGDWLFWFDIARQGKICEVPQKLNSFRQHANKVSNEALQKADLAEICAIQQYVAQTLQLNNYQWRCLRGRQSKRLNKSQYPDKETLRQQFPKIYKASPIDYVTYTLDKLFNLSGMQ